MASQPSTTDEAVSAGLPLPDRWDVAGPHPQEPTWQTMLGPITVLHDDHSGVLIAGQWEDVTPEQVDELAEKLHAVARWLRLPGWVCPQPVVLPL